MSVATTLYPSDPRVYTPSAILVTRRTPRSRLDWDTPLRSDSSPPFRPFHILYDPNQIGVRFLPPPSSLYPLLVAAPVLLHITYQRQYFLRAPPPFPLPSPTHAGSSRIPPHSQSHSLLQLPLPCRPPQHGALHIILIPGQVAHFRGYCDL